ncbi:MAG TPA: outer membrane protein assembly factor BamA [Gammaproteobacteria bacterium]|nr:outer membrane protein assembly factor BamA [Gammaproteobacteria bacterium]
MSLKKITITSALVLLISGVPAFAAEEFVVKNIEIDGLQRITRQTVLEYLPIRPGQVLSESDTASIINSLYQTGFFSDVSLARKGDTLVIQVVERATIGLIKINGNKQVKSEDLLAALKQAGIAEGENFNQATIAGMKQALLEQYHMLGRYDATVDTQVTPESRNRVQLTINISEGHIAKVKQINIIGNNTFSEKELVASLPMAPTHWWQFFSKSGDYSADKLEQDLDALRSFYFDRGYLRFKVNSSQVTITPNRKDVFITISVTEGDIYRVKGFNVAGDLLGDQANVEKMITLKPNEVFSRKKVLAISDRIKRYYGNQGYANATVNANPVIDDANKQVFLTFEVNPGSRIYVRNIDYTGNTKTADYVFRRETRQMEGAAYSVSQIDESKRRISNLGYVDNVDVKMEPVPGTNDQVDLKYSFKETSSTTATAQVGYSDTYGFLYGANITQRNYKGTGKSVSLGFNNSQAAQTYSFNYFNPYYTQSGISRGFSVYFQRSTPEQINLTSYTMDAYGAMMNYRMPMSEYDYLSFGYGYEYLRLSGGNSAQQIQDFYNAHGQDFNNVKLTGGWTHNTYDRAIMPTKGFNQYLGAEVGVPVLPKSLDYFKLFYNATVYQPIARGFIVALNTNLGYGNGYAGFGDLPFFKNYYAGGIGTVRGYEGNTLGPRDSNNNPIGGNVEATGSFNLIFPNPFSEKFRTSVFLDAGNVFENQLNFNEMRTSAGLEVDWVSPLGPLKFSLAQALNPRSNDDLQFFQFSVGTSL